MVRSLPVLFALVLLPVAAPAGAGPEIAKTVDIQFQNTPLRSAFEKLAQGQGVSFRFDPDVPNVPITLSLDGVEPETAVRLTWRVARSQVPQLELAQDGLVWVLRISTAAIPDPLLDVKKDPRFQKSISLEAGPTLRGAARAILEKSGVRHLVLPSVPDTPMKLTIRDQTAAEALEAMLRAGGPDLYLGQEGKVLLIGLRSAPAPQAQGSKLPGRDRRGALTINNVGLRAVLRLLYRDSGIRLEVSPEITDVSINTAIRDRTLDEAVDQVVGVLAEQGVKVKVERDKDNHRLLPAG